MVSKVHRGASALIGLLLLTGYAVAEWNSHGQYQYYFNNNRVYWDQGLAFCRSQKPTAFLARPITENAEFLKGFGSAEMYWADHSYGSQGWAWSDGSPLPAGDIHWYSGYPHLSASVVSRGLYERSSAALMNDEPNNYKYGGPGWLDVVTGDGSCYYLSSSDPDAGNFTWDGAAQACADQQASLASVPDLITFYALSFQVRGGGQNVWTGLISVPMVGYSWSDGSEFDEQLKQFIVPGNGTVGYLSADDGEFHLADADQSAAFACCTAPAPAPTTTAPPPAEPCPAGWEQSEDTCYLFSEQHGYWTEAMSACHQEEADLLSIHDDMLITFLVLRVGNNTFWTGLQNQNTTYVWQDGSSTDDIDLVEPYLDPWQSGKDCVAMNTELYIPKQQFLIHDDCFAENRFVCQKPAN
ncbi:Lymphocyte antigen 75 [Amphibalanus amphitrite]|uniref:Lymphocyte antigen 75 n=1 Tax=Amphibalanus amphitrite TaxID=1232801 RepID=A0A6A4VY24_AMPAM|nr:Lymphocyte antigen 75 [Amphibalanus amphitrite]